MTDNKNNLFLTKYHLLWFFGLCLLIIVLVEAFEFFMNYQFLDFGKLFKFTKFLYRSQFSRIYLIGCYQSVLPLQYLFIFLPAIFLFVLIFRLSKKKIGQCLSLAIILLLSLLLVSVHEKSIYNRWHNRCYDIANSYLNVQKWAKVNTRFDSLFMIDPSNVKAWQEFAERSSFGTFRQWLHTSIIVNSKSEILAEGLQRSREFNINVEKVAPALAWKNEKKRHGIYYQKLNRDVRKCYYTMSADKLKSLCNKYRINYIVMNRKYHKPVQQVDLLKKFRIVYMNDHFIVYTSGKQKYDF